MLQYLYIKDFGIIEKTEINFTQGLNVLSGETGAGKSIVIDAIKIVTGGRALSEYVRTGSDLSVVQAAFDNVKNQEIYNILNDNGIYCDAGELLILSREINRNGRNLCRINGQIVNLSVFKEIGCRLIDIQGQNEQQMLLDTGRQLHILDAFGGKDLLYTSKQVARLYQQHSMLKKSIEHIQEKSRDTARKVDLIKYQIAEIDNASLSVDEEEKLLIEKNRLANIEKISQLLNECYQYLYCGSPESPCTSIDLTGKAMKAMDKLAELDPSLAGCRDLLANSFYQLEEACRQISEQIENIDYLPVDLESVEKRLYEIQRLKKKYGNSIKDILDYRNQIEQELNEIETAGQNIESMEKELSQLTGQLNMLAGTLTRMRKEAALKLEKDIAQELTDLEMSGVVFKIVFSEETSITASGKEKAEFFISTNPGEPLKPISKVASGGETSRLMLAIKAVLAETEGIPTLVFDEIDTGIGGKTIWSLSQKLNQLSKSRQVICVTHSSPLASTAQNHLLISKYEEKGRTFAEVKSLDEAGRLKELTRMLGGAKEDTAAFDLARELLKGNQY